MDTSLSPAPVSPATITASSAVTPRRFPKAEPERSRPSFVFFGILLPIVTLTIELLTHECGLAFFDPVPTWWHVALIALLPLANFTVWLSWSKRRCSDPRLAAHVQGAALAVSLIYALLIGPLTPVAAIGVAFAGFGLLPLTPLCAFIATWRGSLMLRSFLPEGGLCAPLGRGFLVGALALGIPAGWDVFTDHRLDVAAHGTPQEQQRAIEQLRTWGHWGTLLERCYRQPRWGADRYLEPSGRRDLLVSTTDAARIFFRVTGTPFNARPTPASVSGTGRRVFDIQNRDAALGGERVLGKVGGLTLEKSRLETTIQPAALTSYTEWTFEFKNVAGDPNEARAQLQLPPGGAVSRLTLWIGGEPREAAFGSRAQARAAYQEVAVVQRRDPVLVTTSGPDRVLMQCFPVPANGGVMKVRVGITAPLHVVSREEALFLPPKVLETNYQPREALAHELSILDQSAGIAAVTECLNEQAFTRRGPVRVARSPDSDAAWTEDPSDPAFAIRQIVREIPPAAARHVSVVLDGSRGLRVDWAALAQVLAEAADSPENRGRISLHFAGDIPATWPTSETARAWLDKLRPAGGQDNLPSLVNAWKAAGAGPDGIVLWVHGPQPMELSDLAVLKQAIEERVARGDRAPHIYDLSLEPGPNRILEGLADFTGWRRADIAPSSSESVARLLAKWSGKAPDFVVERERLTREAAWTSAPAEGDRHLAQLWGLGEVERLRATSDTLNDAVKLALQLQLVTSVSGAVVLEHQEQYDRHGLKPIAPSSAPSIPEPTAAMLLAAGAACLGTRRRR